MQLLNIQADDVIDWDSTHHQFDGDSILAVNAAYAADRPLLVRGEPGVGKSQLARAVAEQTGRTYVQHVVDSRTESRDLLWTFDAVARLADAQLGTMGETPEQMRARLSAANYLCPGPLWWAFNWGEAAIQAHTAGAPVPVQSKKADSAKGCVVLVDEIDKAETDVPNGLLEALGQASFTPLGRDRPVTPGDTPRPLVLITTNEERALPDAFLRRCLVLFLELPTEQEALIRYLQGRGRVHFAKKAVGDKVLEKAAIQLAEDRQNALEHNLRPLPGQAEYLDLLRASSQLAPENTARQLELLASIARFTFNKHSGAG